MAREEGVRSGASPSLTDSINVANITYSQPGIGHPFPKTFPDGLKLLKSKGKPVTEYNALTGFYGAAFVTPQDQVIVGYEGTNVNTGSDLFTAAQAADDSAIYFGANAPSYNVALRFTRIAIRDAAAKGIGRGDVSLAGHSLGGADAEYVAARTGLAGTTFGAPGIPVADSRPGHPSRLTNYVEDADPVGNYAAGSPLGSIVTSDTIQHFGNATIIGSDPYRLLPNAATAHRYGDYPAELAFLGAAIPNHYLTQYASDLHVKLGGADNTVGSDSSFFTPATSLATVASPNVVTPSICFASGTLIRTTRGDIAVEALRVGDLAVTASGAHRPIKWIGSRTIDAPTFEQNPVRILAGAFGGDLPDRDLCLSPGHPVLVGDHLVPIMNLINGTSVARTPVETVTYWHIELDPHDVLLAEGLPAESYFDMGSRPWFEGDDSALSDPDLVPPGSGGRCLPVALDGPVVAAERRRLDALFATRLVAQCAWPTDDVVAADPGRDRPGRLLRGSPETKGGGRNA